jgi:hypothetical protein
MTIGKLVVEWNEEWLTKWNEGMNGRMEWLELQNGNM